MKTGFGWIHAKPATSFSPVAVTPDELGAAWKDGRVCLPIRVSWNGREFGHPDAGAMGFGFHELIAHAAYSRNLSAGTIIGSGTVSNANYRTVGSGVHRRAASDRDRGSAGKPSRTTCASATVSASRCSTPTAAAFSARSTSASCRRMRSRRADDGAPRKSALHRLRRPRSARGGLVGHQTDQDWRAPVDTERRLRKATRRDWNGREFGATVRDSLMS